MKNALLPVVALATVSTPALADLTFYDPFNYSDPGTKLADHTNVSYVPSRLWYRSPAGTTTDPDVTEGNLTYPGLPAPIGNSVLLNNFSGASRVEIGTFTEPADGEVPVHIYYSLIMRVTDLTGLSNTLTGSFFTGLNYQYPEATTVADGMNSGAQSSMGPITIRFDGVNNAYNLGIAVKDAPAATTRIFDTAPYTTDDTLFLVVKYVLGSGNQDDSAHLYINPSSSTFGGTEPAAPTVSSVNDGTFVDFFYNNTTGLRTVDSSGNPLTAIRSMILRNNAVEPRNIQVDELRVGTTWADVTRATLPGDANGDGKVDADDFALIDRGLALNLIGWANGDFNFDGAVDQADFLIIDQSFLSGGGSASGLFAQRQGQFGSDYVAALAASVPEPTAAGALLAPFLTANCRRRRA